jgi:hypothetical protein
VIKKTLSMSMIFIIFVFANTAIAKTLQCPPPEKIQIIKNPDRINYPKDPMAWIGPDISGFATTTAPQQGSVVYGQVTGVEAEYQSSVAMYDLLCQYPTDKSTTRIPLPPMTGYVGYRVYNVPEGYCKMNDNHTGFICG